MHRPSPPSVVALLLLAALWFALALLFIPTAKGSEISKSDIAATVAHIRKLALEQKEQLIQAQREFEAQGVQLVATERKAQQWEDKALENGKEKDVVLFAFAIFFALYVGTIFAGEIMRDFPAPWNLIATGCCYVVVGGLAYGLGQMVLHSLAHLIP